MIGRRGFITGLVSLVAAPAIVRVGSLMPVRAMEPVIVGLDFGKEPAALVFGRLMSQRFPSEWLIDFTKYRY